MRLAICFFGQPRYLGNTIVYERYKQINDRYNADVYVHSWITGTTSQMETSDWAKKHSFTENENSASIILSKYNPKKFRFDPPFAEALNEHDDAVVRKMRMYTENNKRNLLSHLKSYSEAIKLVENPETYDFILMTRFDACLMDFPDLYDLDSSKFYLTKAYDGGWCDLTQLCGGLYHKAFDVYDNFSSISNILSTKDPTMIAKLYKRENYDLYFDRKDVRYIERLSSCLVRSENGLINIQW